MAHQVGLNSKSVPQPGPPGMHQPVVLNKDAIGVRGPMPAGVRQEASGISSPSYYQNIEGKNTEYVDV